MTDSSRRPRTFILGIDGMAHWLVRKLMADGRLPALARLRERGAYMHLQSTLPYHSAAAWSSITTGTNPGRHGLIDFIQHDPAKMQSWLVSSTDVDVRRFYDYAGACGKRVCIANIPVTYPPAEVNGFLMTGQLTPSSEHVFTYPPEASIEIRKNFGPPRFAAHGAFRAAQRQQYADTLIENIDYHGRLYDHLLRTQDADLFMLVIMECDHATHKLWGPFEPNAPSSGTEKGPWDENFVRVLQRADHWVGVLVEQLTEQDTILVLSDHGCAPLHGAVNINRWLMQQGFLVPRHGMMTRVKNALARLDVVSRAYRVAARLGLGDLVRKLPRKFRHSAVGSFQSLAKDVDWSRTTAYCMGAYGTIWVNLKGREPDGIVEQGQQYEDVCRQVAEGIRELRTPDGRTVAEEVCLKSELYDGPLTDSLPDVVFGTGECGLTVSKRFGMAAGDLFEPDPSGSTGMHDRHAFLLVAGPGVQAGADVRDARLEDVAPTALYAAGCPVPAYMDGRVLTDIFNTEHLAAHPPESDEDAASTSQGEATGSSEQDGVKQRLTDLGYM